MRRDLSRPTLPTHPHLRPSPALCLGAGQGAPAKRKDVGEVLGVLKTSQRVRR